MDGRLRVGEGGGLVGLGDIASGGSLGRDGWLDGSSGGILIDDAQGPFWGSHVVVSVGR